MKTFAVEVKEVWSQVYHVEANTPEEAIRRVAEGQGKIQEQEFEFSDTLDSEYWQVCEMKDY